MLRRLASFCKSSLVHWVAVITLLVLVLLLWRPTFTEFLELKFYDLKFRVRGPRPPGPAVVIVAIDDASLKEVGRWPWSREDMARLLARIKEAGPKVIGLDIIFAEREETAGLRTLTQLRRQLTAQGRASPEILALLAQEEALADVDRRLVQVVSQGTPTVLGFYFQGVGGQWGGPLQERLMGSSLIRASTYNMVRLLDAQPSQLPLLGANGAETNLPEITAAAAGGGYFNMVPDTDGAIRWFPMTVMYGPDFFAPMVLVTLDHYLGRPPMGLTLSRLGVEEVRLGRRLIPADRYGRLLINFLGPAGMIPTYSAAAVLKGALPPETLKDKIVLVGATAVGIYDLRVTPFSGIFPGIEIQATVLENLLHGHFLKTPPMGLLLEILLILGMGVLLGLVLPRLSAAWSFVFILFLAQGFLVGNYLLFSRQGLQMGILYPLLEIVGVYLGITVQRFLSEERERQRIRKAFESYVAPAVVQEMLKHPELLRLGGERRDITLLFSDIRGFTTMSEHLEPGALVSLLHDFLNPMSNIIVDEEGTIDKYMGDAIMALFGAPLEQPDQADRACRAALKMVAALNDLNRAWAAQGRPPLSVGIGINTGPAAVGNMGSDRLFDYTAIGDNVNLASRLEGLNKYFGTGILISTATAEALNGRFILREVGMVRVKGKKQPITIYELMGEGTPEGDLARFLETFHQGLALFRERHWAEGAAAFAEARQLRPQDQQSRTYEEMCEGYRQEPPGPDWQPVTDMETK